MIKISLGRRGRDRLSVISEILDIAKEGALKTKIMYEANLSYHDLNEYLSFLLKIRLLKVTAKRGHKIYKTSNKGLLYLDNYLKIRGLLVHTRPDKSYEAKPSLESFKSEIRRIKRLISALETNLARLEQCPACGKQILPDFSLCPYCGKELLEVSK